LGDEVRDGISKRITRWGRSSTWLPNGPQVCIQERGSLWFDAGCAGPLSKGTAYVVGTFDTKQRELSFVANLIAAKTSE